MTKKLNCVLLIDDDELTNYLHKIILESTNVTSSIEVAETAKEALQLLEHLKVAGYKNPELIFLDLNMPGMTGWDFIEKIRESKDIYPDNSLIFILTTSVNQDDRKKAAKIKEVTGFINKPLTDEIILEILQQYFSN